MKIICPKCNNEISSTDTKCINCGLDMSTIEYELKKQQLIKEGKIKDNTKRKKAIVVIIELVVFITITIVYYKLFIPRILEITKENKIEQQINDCKEQDGIWDYTSNNCNYE